MKKNIIRKIWKAWAKLARLRWDIAAKYEEGTLHTLRFDAICEEDKTCHDALVEWATLNELCEELDIDWMNMTQIDAETASAADEHTLYSDLVWKHTIH